MRIEYNPYSNTNKDFVAINIRDDVSYSSTSKLFCNLCSCNLILSDPDNQGGEWWCERCHVSYFPNRGQKVKRPSRFETPGPNTDRHGNITGERGPIVSMVNDDNATFVRPLRNKFPRSMEYLKRSGVNITSLQSSVDDEGI